MERVRLPLYLFLSNSLSFFRPLSPSFSLSISLSLSLPHADVTSQGFCRRILLPNRFPRCFCLLSPYPCFEMYNKILDIVERTITSAEGQQSQNWKSVTTFIEEVYRHPMPPPGKSISISLPILGNASPIHPSSPSVVSLLRPDDADSSLEYVCVCV